MKDMKVTFMFLVMFVVTMVHIFSKTYVEEFRLSVRLSTKSVTNITLPSDEDVVQTIMNLKKLKSMSGRLEIETSKQINVLDKKASVFMKIDSKLGDYTPNSDTQISCASDKTVKLLVLVQTPYKDITRRMIIREAWKQQMDHDSNRLNWKMVFVVSSPDQGWEEKNFFRTEMKFKRDMLLVERPERQSESAKKLYSALRWSANGCKFEYLLMTDSNTKLNFKAIYNIMHSPNMTKGNLVMGHKLTEKSSITFRPVKTSITKTELISRFSSTQFLMSRDVLTKVLHLLRWYSTHGRVQQPMAMLALAMKDRLISPLEYKHFLTKLPNDCKVTIEKTLLMQTHNDDCFRNPLMK
ncbi:uncharacterized protein [Clytia hemisphaerica]|uniref:uncharacterized protein n=1 Tax=Clytia hemisphaerica TaxID=252671 RepID=UPI0034D43B71|eukprot:TCONS_00073251-protein